MSGSLYLGRVFGIKLKVHFTFLLIFVYVGYYSFQAYHSWTRLPYDFLIIIVAFVFVVMHEFGHALAARRVGIETRQVLILPIGGMAQLDNMPENPKDELFVTVCGPLVNLAIVILCVPLFLVNHSFADLFDTMNLGNDWIVNIIGINLILFIFNLVPAFPMDGGRIFRALLAFRFNYQRATLVAARTGQIIALAVIAGFMYLDFIHEVDFFNIIKLLILCVFIIWLAEMEYRMVKSKSQMGYYDVIHPDFQNPGMLNVGNSLQDALYELSRNGSKNISILNQNQVAGVITATLPTLYANMNGHEIASSHTWKASPNDTLGHALRMMEILEIPVISLGGMASVGHYYLLRKD